MSKPTIKELLENLEGAINEDLDKVNSIKDSLKLKKKALRTIKSSQQSKKITIRIYEEDYLTLKETEYEYNALLRELIHTLCNNIRNRNVQQ